MFIKPTMMLIVLVMIYLTQIDCDVCRNFSNVSNAAITWICCGSNFGRILLRLSSISTKQNVNLMYIFPILFLFICIYLFTELLGDVIFFSKFVCVKQKQHWVWILLDIFQIQKEIDQDIPINCWILIGFEHIQNHLNESWHLNSQRTPLTYHNLWMELTQLQKLQWI